MFTHPAPSDGIQPYQHQDSYVKRKVNVVEFALLQLKKLSNESVCLHAFPFIGFLEKICGWDRSHLALIGTNLCGPPELVGPQR